MISMHNLEPQILLGASNNLQKQGQRRVLLEEAYFCRHLALKFRDAVCQGL